MGPYAFQRHGTWRDERCARATWKDPTSQPTSSSCWLYSKISSLTWRRVLSFLTTCIMATSTAPPLSLRVDSVSQLGPRAQHGPRFTQLRSHGCDLCDGCDAVFEPVKSSNRAASSSSFFTIVLVLIRKTKKEKMARRTWQAIVIMGAVVCVCVRINGGMEHGAHVILGCRLSSSFAC